VKVKWTNFAADQLNEIVDGLVERKGHATARAVARRILERIERLCGLPRSAPRWLAVSDESFRRLVVGNHIVLYRVAENEGIIYILAVRHGRQRPLDGDEVPEA
jgi:plasmid stabilization system protein ParE